MNKLAPKAEQAALVRRGGIIAQAAEHLHARKTRTEALGHKRKTTRDVYIAIWVNFGAFMRFRASGNTALLNEWVNKSWESKQACLDYLEDNLAAVTHHDVQAYKRALLELPTRRGVGLSHSTVTLRLSALKHLFKIATREGVTEYNPASSEYVDRERRAPKRKKHVLTVEEVQQIIAYGDVDLLNMRNTMLFMLLAWTGMRRQEASELFIGDFVEHPEGMTATIRQKGDKIADLLLPKKLEAQLEYYIESLGIEGALFPAMRRNPRTGKVIVLKTPLTPDSITKIIRTMTKEVLGVAYGPHRLRHFFANTAYDGGGTIEQIQDYLGHNSPQTTRGYLDIKLSRERSAAELIDLTEPKK